MTKKEIVTEGKNRKERSSSRYQEQIELAFDSKLSF